MDIFNIKRQGDFSFKLSLHRRNTSKYNPRQEVGQESAEPSNPNDLNITMVGSNEFAYLAHIKAADQDLMVTVDTGSSDLWIASDSCTLDACQGIALYKNSSSLSVTDTPFDLKYLSGNVRGQISYETISLGRFEITSQVFGLVSNLSGIDIATSGSSGILGLAFPKPAAIPATMGPTILENIMNGIPTESRYFGFMAGRGSEPGSLTMGQLDDSIVANRTLQRTAVHPNPDGTYDYWKLPLQSIIVNNQTLPLSETSEMSNSPNKLPIAIFDTGTTLILGPQEDVDLIYSVVRTARRRSEDGNEASSDTGKWEIDCTEAVDIKLRFVLDGQTEDDIMDFWINPLDMTWDGIKNTDGKYCLGGIQGNNNVVSGDWLLGDTALRNIYVAHYVGTDVTPPNLALLAITDQESAMSDFVTTRGAPTFMTNSTLPTFNRTSSASSRRQTTPNIHAVTRQHITLIILATIIAFAVGLGAALIFMMRRERQRWARMHGFQGTVVKGKRIKTRAASRFWTRG